VPGGLLAFGLSSNGPSAFFSFGFYAASIVLGISLGSATILVVLRRRRY
jgi:hypothetical protein